MSSDPARWPIAGKTPMQIAAHARLSAKEKLDLLETLRARTAQSRNDPGFSPQEVDDAINQVKRDAREGEEFKTVIWGDN